jgi:hypothetical protein
MRLTDRLKQLMGHELEVPDVFDRTKVFAGKLVEVGRDYICIRGQNEEGQEMCDHYFPVVELAYVVHLLDCPTCATERAASEMVEQGASEGV